MIKSGAKTKQQPEAELLLYENYSFSSFMLSSKTNLKYSKKFAIDYNENEDENDK